MKWHFLAIAVCALWSVRAEAAPQLVVEQPAGSPLNPRRVVAWGGNSDGQTTVPAGLTNVQAIAAGFSHSVALRSDGTVAAWGSNASGQTRVPLDLAGVQAVSAGSMHSLALKDNGVMVVMGPNVYGGDLPGGESGLRQVAAGGFSLGLKTDGTPRVWGALGNLNVPAGLSGVDAVAAGANHAMALLRDGRVTVWGSDSLGQRAVPAGLEGVQAIAAGWDHCLALKRDGTVIGWGNNHDGQASPPAGLDGVESLSGGYQHSAALKRDGTVVAWGNNILGQTSVPAGLGAVQAVAAGGYHTLALTGSTVEFDSAPVGQSGGTRSFTLRNTGSSSLNFQGVSVAGGNAAEFQVDTAGMLTSLPPFTGETTFRITFTPAGLGKRTTNLRILSNVSEFGALLRGTGSGPELTVYNGTGSVTANERTNNTGTVVFPNTMPGTSRSSAFTIGNRGNADLAGLSLTLSGDTGHFVVSSPVVPAVAPYGNFGFNVTFAPTSVGLHRAELVIAGSAEGAAPFRIAFEGFAASVRALGIESPSGTVLPQRVLEWGNEGNGNNVPANWTDVTAVAVSADQAFALKRDGTLMTWGPFFAPLGIPAGLRDVVAIAAGDEHCVALRNDGTVAAWGGNTAGQTNLPAGLRDVMAITAGYQHTVALKRDGTLVAWGANTYGQTTIPAGLSGVKAVVAGYYHNLALKDDGSVTAWGRNDYGQKNVPAGLTGVRAMAAGAYHSVVLRADRTVQIWGRNDYGQSTVPAGLTDVDFIAAGRNHTMAQLGSGTLRAWGRNDRGQINVPAGISGVQSIAGGIYRNLARAGVVLPFAVQDPATSSAPKLLTLRNTGNLPLTIQRISIVGKHPMDYAVDPVTTPMVIDSIGSSTGVAIRFTPSAGGSREALLRIETDADADPVLWVSLTGTGSRQAIIRAWRQAHFSTALPEGSAGDLADPDHDGVVNLLEFASGTDPVNADSGSSGLKYSGTLADSGTLVAVGQPVTLIDTTPGVNDYRILFVRRRDYLEAGLSYTMQFSESLSSFGAYPVQPTILAQDENYQILSLPYPVYSNGQRARFARLSVTLAP